MEADASTTVSISATTRVVEAWAPASAECCDCHHWQLHCQMPGPGIANFLLLPSENHWQAEYVRNHSQRRHCQWQACASQT
jgi:hypothetical protein